ncbi:hypothetical protein Tco_0472175, partial [Tanacetum coccineum]
MPELHTHLARTVDRMISPLIHPMHIATRAKSTFREHRYGKPIAQHRAELTMVHPLSQTINRDGEKEILCVQGASVSGDRERIDIAYERQEKRNGLCLLLPRPPNLIGRVASRHCQSPNPDPEAVTIFSKEARNLYGLSNFVKAALKKEEVDIGLVAKLIASYDLIKEVAKVRGCDIYVNESTKAEVFIDSCAKVPLIEVSVTSLTNYICYLEMTFAITGEGLYEGWTGSASKSVSSMLLLKYDGMPIGYTSQPTNEGLIDFVVLLTNGKDIIPNRVGRVDLFNRHPAAIIRDSIHSGHPLPCMLGTCKVSGNQPNILKSCLATFLTTQHDWEKNKDFATNLSVVKDSYVWPRRHLTPE